MFIRTLNAVSPGNKSKTCGQIAPIMVGSMLACVSVVGAGAWHLAPSQVIAKATAERSITLNVPYQEFRTLLIRKDAAQEIAKYSGVEIIEEQPLKTVVDLSKDRRPLLNALFRQSKSKVSSKKRLIVSMNKGDLETETMALIQEAEISPQQSDITSHSENESGCVKDYECHLHAEPEGDKTVVTFRTQARICKNLSKVFHNEAQKRVDLAVQDSVDKQCLAIEKFMMDNAEELSE